MLTSCDRASTPARIVIKRERIPQLRFLLRVRRTFTVLLFTTIGLGACRSVGGSTPNEDVLGLELEDGRAISQLASDSSLTVVILRSMLARTLPDARRALDTSRLTALFDPANAPDSAPYASSLVPVHDGTVWVETFALDSSIARTYIALDSIGRTRGVYSTPAGCPASVEM